MSVAVRKAQREDAEFLAWVMLAASRSQLKRGIWDLIICDGERADDEACLNYLKQLAVAEPRSLYHYENFLVAELDGRPAAALCGFEMSTETWKTVAEAMSAVQREMEWMESDVAASQQRVAPIWACFLEDAGADWIVENIATKPECRGQGATSALIEEIVREGARHGRKLAQISTYIGNDAAQAVYEKCGFQFSDEKHCAELERLLGAPGFVRLLRKLGE
jgi:ribosomal protein S18 acetylase RimI-like enzyme